MLQALYASIFPPPALLTLAGLSGFALPRLASAFRPSGPAFPRPSGRSPASFPLCLFAPFGPLFSNWTSRTPYVLHMKNSKFENLWAGDYIFLNVTPWGGLPEGELLMSFSARFGALSLTENYKKRTDTRRHPSRASIICNLQSLRHGEDVSRSKGLTRQGRREPVGTVRDYRCRIRNHRNAPRRISM